MSKVLESKLDRVIELLERQNRLLEVNSNESFNSFPSNVGTSPVGQNMPDVKSMIEQARKKAMAQVNPTI